MANVLRGLVTLVACAWSAGVGLGQTILQGVPTWRDVLVPQTSLSGQTPLSSARLNSREGAAVGGNTLGLWLEADPSASSLEAMRSIGPVDLFTGKVEWRDVQIALPAHVPWVVGVAYSNAQSAAGGSNGPQGWNWQQLSQPELVRRQANAGQWGAGDAILLVYGGRYAEYWRQNALNPVLVGVNGTGGGIRLWTATTSGGSYEMVDVLDTKGWKATFWGWGNVPAGLRGQLWRIENEGGQRAYVGHPTDPGLAAAQGFNASGLLATAYDSAGRRYTYSYTVGAVGGRVRLSSVVAAAQSGGQWVEVQRAEYRYWGTSEFAWGGSTVPAERGADGDLSLIRVVTPLSVAGTSLTTRQHFRYWLGNEGVGAGAAHDLRLIVAEEGARQAASAGVSLTAGSLQQVRRFAQSTMAYSGGRVSVLGVPVTATVAGTVPEMTLGYDTGAGQWARRTRITYPATGGADPLRLEHQMFDGWGGPLSRAVLAAAPSTPSVITGKWVTAVVRDSGGMVQSVGSPASVAAYDEATGVVTLATNQGLVRTVDRVPSGGAPGVPAAAAGLVSGTWAQQGHQMISSPTRQQETAQTWSIRSVGDGVTSPVLMRAYVSSSSVYRDTQPGNRGVGSTTEFAWAFEPGKLTPRSVVTTDPAVSVERNGRGTPFTRTQHYFANGLPSVSVSEAGRLVSNEYDAATGQLTRSLFDALVADVPAGAIASGVTLTDWPIANAGPALRRETRYVYDAVGRISVVQHPGTRFTAAWPGGIREMSQTVYSKIANETLLVIDVPMVLGTPASPTGWRGVADVRTVNHAGVTIASGTVATGPRGPAWHAQNATTQSPTTWAVSGASDLAAAFPAASGRPLLSYTRATTWSHSGQIPTQWQSRVNATGSAWLTSGIEFDVLGRLRASTGPDGTRTELRLDARGLVTSVYRGFTSPGQAVSRMIAEFAYDNEGRLTSRTVRPRPDEPLLMEFRYNWKGDLLAQINPTEPHLLMAYNGIGQLTGQAIVGGPGAALLAALPNYNGRDLLAMALPLGPRRETLLDELGRPYREKQFGKRDGACTEAPASPGIDSVTPMVADHWRGAHGNVTMSAGETVTRTGYDRACGVQQINVIATTPTAPAGQQPISYQNATGGVNANDNVLQTTYFARNRTNGEVVGLAMAVRDSRQFDGDANFRGPLIIDNPFKYGPTGISPVPTGIQIPSNPGNVHPEMLLRMTFPDEFGRPQIERDYGRQPKPGDPELCCGIDCGLPPIGIEPPREQRREYRDDLKWHKLIKPDGSIDSFYFDDLGRTSRHCEEPWGIYHGPSMPAKIPGMPEVPGCNKKQTETKWEYEDARLRRIIRSDCSNPSETGGPSTILENFFPTDGLIAPGGMVFTPPTNASAVIAIRQGDMGMYYRDLDEMGRPRQMLDPRNVLRTLRYAVGGVPTGRLEGITISQPQGQIGQFGPAEMFIKPTYDLFGTLEGVEQRAGENGCLLDKISTPTGVLGQPCKTITCLGMSCGTTPSGCGSTDPNAPGPQGLRLSQTTNFEYAAFGLNGGVIGGAGAGQWGGIRETRRTLPGGGGLGMYHPGFGPGTGSGWQTALNTGTGRLEALILEPGGSSVHPTNPVFRQGYLGIWKPRWTDLPDIQGVWWHHLPSKTPDGPVTPMFYRPKDEFGQPSNERFEIYRDDIPKFDPPPEQDLPPPPLIWSSIEYARGANGVLTDKAVQIREPRMSFFEASPDLPATDWVKDRYFDCNGEPYLCGITGPKTSGGGQQQQVMLATQGIGGQEQPLAAAAGPGFANPTFWRVQQFRSDGRGNWTHFWDSRRTPAALDAHAAPSGWDKANPIGTPWNPWDSASGTGDRVFASVFNRADQNGAAPVAQQAGSPVGSRKMFVDGGGTSNDVSPVFDAAGNLIDDGQQWCFVYDGLNRLVGVQRRLPAGGPGSAAAKFVYNAMGQRVAAIYDRNGDGELSDEVAELYTYDEHWRLTAVYVQGPAANGARPEPAAQPRERYVWQPGAFDNSGGDRLVLRERDLDGDGVFEERVCFLQNARGDVVAVYSAGDGGDNKRVLLERVRYTEYGEPMCYAAADINLDGRVDASDESAWLALLQMGGMNPVTGEPDRRMDLNGDGDVTQADFDLWDVAYRQARQKPTGNPAAPWMDDAPFNGVAEGGVLSVPTRSGTYATGGGTWVMHGVDNRFGFAGYMWDPFLKLYHVRHRVYDPMGGRWLQRDPIGMAGGWNLYQYCGGEPWGMVDPMGLEGITIGEFFSALGTELWGHQGFVASFSDGVGGLFDGTASDVVAAAAVQAEINTAARTGGEVTETGVAMTLLAQFIGAQDIATAVTGYDANVDGIVDTTDRVAAGLRGGGAYILIASGGLPGQKVPGKVPGAADDVPKTPTAPAAAEPAGGACKASGNAPAGKPRFVADDAGNIVDTSATPPGRYIQPDGSATDILQKANHPGLDPFTARTHTHPATVNRNPLNPAQGSTRLGEPRPVTPADIWNILSGKAVRSTPRGR